MNIDINIDIFVKCNWFELGGSGTVHIYTQQYIEHPQQYIEQRVIGKIEGCFLSLRVLPWH